MAELFDWEKTASAISVGAIPDWMLKGYQTKPQGQGEPRRYQIMGEGQLDGDPQFSSHPYHKDGPASFIDVFEQPDRVNVAYMSTAPEHRGQGHAKALMQNVYDSYPDKKIYWGTRDHDASEHMWQQYRQTHPERTASIKTAAPNENWIYLKHKDWPEGQIQSGAQPHHLLIHRFDNLDGDPLLGMLGNTWVAGNGMPKGMEHEVARGTYDKKGRPQIWESNIDRNHVYEMAKTAASVKIQEWEGEVGNTQHITCVQKGWLPTEKVANMPGGSGEMPGEHHNRQGQFWQGFLNDIRENGIKEPLFIYVDYGKEPVLAEGNHRRDAAVELGLPEVPVEIRYFGHAEQQQRLAGFTIKETVEEMYAKLQGQGWDVLNYGESGGRYAVTIQNAQGNRVERTGNTQEQAFANALTWAWQHSHMSKQASKAGWIRDMERMKQEDPEQYARIGSPCPNCGRKAADTDTKGCYKCDPIERTRMSARGDRVPMPLLDTEGGHAYEKMVCPDCGSDDLRNLKCADCGADAGQGHYVVYVNGDPTGVNNFDGTMTLISKAMKLPIPTPTKRTLGQVFARLRPNEIDGNHLGLTAHSLGYTKNDLDTFLELQEIEGAPRGWRVFKEAAVTAYCSRGWHVEAAAELQVYMKDGGMMKEQVDQNRMEQAKQTALQMIQQGDAYRATLVDPLSQREIWDTYQQDKQQTDNPYGWEQGDVVKGQQGQSAPVAVMGDWFSV